MNASASTSVGGPLDGRRGGGLRAKVGEDRHVDELADHIIDADASGDRINVIRADELVLAAGQPFDELAEIVRDREGAGVFPGPVQPRLKRNPEGAPAEQAADIERPVDIIDLGHVKLEIVGDACGPESG